MTDPGRESRLTRHEPVRFRTLAGLGVILLVAAGLIGGAWHFTRERIASNAARRILAEISTVLPASLYDNEPQKDMVLLPTSSDQPLPVYRALQNGRPVAAVLTVSAADGFVGPIRMLVGIAADGRVLGVHVTAQTETPGIGAAIAAEPSPWLAAFAGRSLGAPPEAGWQLRVDGGDFDAIAGATVTSRAVVGGLRRAVQYFAAHKDAIFAPPTARTGTP
jgi:Na+-translocating ferredoxin:NAD+ oxidoreductase subunit G